MFHLCWNQVVDLHVDILPKVSSLSILLTINVIKMENIDFSNRPHIGHSIKGSCFGAAYTKSAPCLVWCQYIICRFWIYFICHVIPRNPSVEMSCIFMGKSTSQYVTTLKSLVTIGIMIIWGKMLHQKRGSYKCVLPLKKWVDWTTTRRQKMSQPQKYHNLKNVHFGKKCPKI